MKKIESLDKEGFYKTKYFKVFSEEIIRNFPPNHKINSALHGHDHWHRVTFLAAVLSWKLELSDTDLNLLLNAGKYHDIGRKTEGRDTMHGYESIKIIKRDKLVELDNNEDQEVFHFIVGEHCFDDEESLARLEKSKLPYNRTEKLYGIFKDCDGLDRVRFGGLDEKFLRNKEARELIDLAGLVLEAL